MTATTPSLDAPTADPQTTDSQNAPRPRTPVGDGVTVGLTLLGVLCGALMLLIGEVVPPLVAFGLLFSSLAVVSGRTPARWVRVLGAVLAAALLAIFSPFAAGDLTHPESAASFGPSWVLVVAGVTTIIACVAAASRRTLRTRAVWGSATLVILAGVVFAIVQASGVQPDVPVAGDVTLAVEGAAFPDQLVVPAGATGLFIDNVDPIRHTFLIEGAPIAQELPGSTARRLELDLPPGEYRYFCDVPGHELMEGQLVVTS